MGQSEQPPKSRSGAPRPDLRRQGKILAALAQGPEKWADVFQSERVISEPSPQDRTRVLRDIRDGSSRLGDLVAGIKEPHDEYKFQADILRLEAQGLVEHLTPGQQKALLRAARVENGQVGVKRLLGGLQWKRDIKKADLLPQYQVKMGDAIVSFSRPYISTEEDRLAVVGFVQQPGKPPIARTFYMSNTGEIWRVAPYIGMYPSRKPGQEGTLFSFFGKGNAENDVALPVPLQMALDNVVMGNHPQTVQGARGERIFYGAIAKDTYPDGKKWNTPTGKAERTFLESTSLERKDEIPLPDFAIPALEWEGPTTTPYRESGYSQTRKEVYVDVDGRACILVRMEKNGKDVVMLSAVQKTGSSLNSYGVYSDLTYDEKAGPLIEYSGSSKSKRFVDNTEKVEGTPIIREYRKAKIAS